MNHPARQQGLTLIEIIVVMALLGILGFISTPYLFGSKEARELEKEANQIAENLRLVQQKSIAAEKGQSYGISFDLSTPDRFTLIPENKVIELKKGIVIDSVTANAVIFSKLTGKPSTPLSLTLVSKGFKSQIEVNELGVITESIVEKR